MGQSNVLGPVAHRLAPLLERIHDEYDEYRNGGPGVPIRCVPVDGGTLAVCGDREKLGRQAIIHAGPDRRPAVSREDCPARGRSVTPT